MLTLRRLPSTPNGTFGSLIKDNEPWLTTCENPWIGNTRNESCIPPGMYECVRYNSRRHGKTFAITGVINRSGIIFHAGNNIRDTKGCILLGGGFGRVHGLPSVTSSRVAMDRFRAAMDVDKFYLNVIGGAEE